MRILYCVEDVQCDGDILHSRDTCCTRCVAPLCTECEQSLRKRTAFFWNLRFYTRNEWETIAFFRLCFFYTRNEGEAMAFCGIRVLIYKIDVFIHEMKEKLRPFFEFAFFYTT